MLLNDVPKAIEPVYSTSFPNEAISLYSGPVDIIYNDLTTEKTTGNISLRWLPSPQVYLEFQIPHNEKLHDTVSIITDKNPYPTKIHLIEINTSNEQSGLINVQLLLKNHRAIEPVKN